MAQPLGQEPGPRPHPQLIIRSPGAAPPASLPSPASKPLLWAWEAVPSARDPLVMPAPLSLLLVLKGKKLSLPA